MGGLQILIIAATAAAATTTVDTNQVVGPCAQLQPIKSGDAITVAVAIGGSSVLWYNNSDPLSKLLSPCSPSTATVSVTVPTLSNPSPNICYVQYPPPFPILLQTFCFTKKCINYRDLSLNILVHYVCFKGEGLEQY